MIVRLTRNPIFALAVFALSGSIAASQPALAQQAPAQPAPAAPAAPGTQAAPIERHPPSGQMRPGYRQGMRPGMGHGMAQGGMRPGMMQGQRGGSGNFRGARSMHKRGGFRGGQAGGFHGGPGDGFRGGPAGGFHGPQGGGMGMEAGFHIGPPGIWWKNPMIVQRLTLTPEQTRKMDDIFQKSRIELIGLKANVETQNAILEPLLSANPPDTARAMAQIDKVAQARADLEKANARMLLGIRVVLTPDQWTKLHQGRGPGGFGQPGASGAQGAPAAPPGGPAAQGRGRGPRNGAPGTTDNLIDPIDQQ